MSTGSIGELAVLIVVSWSVGRPHVRRAVHTFRFSSAATGQRVGVPPLISGWPAREKSPTSFTRTRVALALSPSLSVSPSDSIRPGAVAEASARCGCSRFLVQSYLHEGRCDDMEYIDSGTSPGSVWGVMLTQPCRGSPPRGYSAASVGRVKHQIGRCVAAPGQIVVISFASGVTVGQYMY